MLAAVTMVKDEADVIRDVLLHLASEGVDIIAILDNGSTDSTRTEIESAAELLRGRCEVMVQDDPEVGYYQSEKISALIEELAAERPIDWVVPFDADELWHAGIPLSEFFAEVGEQGVEIAAAGLLSHYSCGPDSQLVGISPFQKFAWRHRDVAPLPKVAFRYRPGVKVWQGAHGVDLGKGTHPTLEAGLLTVRHYPYRSPEQFVRKARNGAAAYAATDLPEGMGNHWRSYGQILATEGEEALIAVYREHFTFENPIDAGLILDPAPFRRWDP